MFYSKFLKTILKNSKCSKTILKVLLLSFVFFSLFGYYLASYKFGSVIEGGWSNSKGDRKAGERIAEWASDLASYFGENMPSSYAEINHINNYYGSKVNTIGKNLKKHMKKKKNTFKPHLVSATQANVAGNLLADELTPPPSATTSDINSLDSAIDLAEDYGINVSSAKIVLSDLETAKAEADSDAAAVSSAQTALTTAMSTKNISNITSAITAAKSYGIDTTAAESLVVVLSAESVLATAVSNASTATTENIDALTNAISTAQAAGVTDVSVAQSHLTQLQEDYAATQAGSVQQGIGAAATYEPFTEGMQHTNVAGCAIPYSESLQFSNQEELLKIFDTDEIVQCESGEPKFVEANTVGELPPGITLISENGKGTNDHMSYNDTIRMCDKSYNMKKNGENSDDKITYGDMIDFIPNGWSGGSFSATVNPNIYGIANVKDMTSTEFSDFYDKYSYCANSTNDPEVTASDNTN